MTVVSTIAMDQAIGPDKVSAKHTTEPSTVFIWSTRFGGRRLLHMSQQIVGNDAGLSFSDSILNHQVQSQLKVLGEITAIFSSMRARFWLRGGWAIDFLLGRITRAHSDIDLVTWVRHRGRVERVLTDAGFQHIPVSALQSDFRKGDVDVQLCFVTRARDERIIANGIPEWVWRPDSLPPQRFHLHGISACVLSPHQLLEEKEVYEQIGRPPRPKDVESKKILQGIIAARSIGQ